MVEITIFELNVEDGSFAANLPFSSGSPGSDEMFTDEESDEQAVSVPDEESGGGSKGLVLLGVLVFLILATAAVKYLTGDDEDDADDPTAPA
ncbi:hypothetical protein [Halovenus halobia]|uniref:hypothetical protein n=1 Tax=Halovenus halobia TaxID=3396622 RepID=UPI003F570A0F